MQHLQSIRRCDHGDMALNSTDIFSLYVKLTPFCRFEFFSRFVIVETKLLQTEIKAKLTANGNTYWND